MGSYVNMNGDNNNQQAKIDWPAQSRKETADFRTAYVSMYR